MQFGKIIVHDKIHNLTKEILLAPPGGSKVRHYVFRVYYDDGSIEKSPTFSVGPVGPGGKMRYISGLIEIEGVYIPSDKKDSNLYLEYHREKLKEREVHPILVDKVNQFKIGDWMPLKWYTERKKIKKLELIEYDTAVMEV